jgi:hypothetical protein
MRSRRRIAWLLVPLVVSAGLALAPGGPAVADVGPGDPSYPAYSSDPVHTYGEPPAGTVVTDVKVAIGSDPSVACPAGYTKRYPDLNMGLGVQVNQKISDYVYTCLKFEPASSLNGGNPGIGELYVSAPTTANCLGSDQQVDGDLNSGMVRFDIEPDYLLFYCIHRPGTNGGSAFDVNPGEGTTYFPTPATGVLRDVQFLAWPAAGEPECVTTDCVDTSLAGGWAYLEVATTFESYCQRYFGADYHPLLRPYEYYDSSGDRGDPVPQDAQVFDLNAGEIGTAQKIYGCVAYTGATANTMSLTLPPAHVGDLVNLKALVDPTDGHGTVRFTSDGATIPGCDAVGFSSGGGTAWQATCSTRGLGQGTHSITAIYSGDATYSSVQATGQEVISQPTNLSVSVTGSARAGATLNFKALVTPTDGNGTVQFASDSGPIPGCAAVPFTSGGGTDWQATCSTSNLPEGVDTIIATYSGDAAYASSSGLKRIIVEPSAATFSGRIVPGLSTSLTLAVYASSTAEGARIVQGPPWGFPSESWTFTPYGDNYLIINQNSNMCLTTDGTAGHSLYQAACLGGTGQLWQIGPHMPDGAYSWILNPGYGLYLDVYGGSTDWSATIDGAPWNGGLSNQSFAVVQ